MNLETFFNNFDLLADAPNGVQKLRELILQLAVMGKLVPQDKNDEPASVLLDKIKTEKEQLVKEGKIKKFDKMSPIKTDEIPYQLPRTWQWVSLTQIISLMDAGWSPACKNHPTQDESKWGVLKTTAVQELEYKQEEHKELPGQLAPRPEYEVKPGDILITRAGPKNRVGICCLVKNTRSRLMISDKIIRFHLMEQYILSDFIVLSLNSGFSKSFIENQKSGMAASQMNISQDKLKMTPISIPPYEEQIRIVAKVDELMAMCDRLSERQQKRRETRILINNAAIGQLLTAREPEVFNKSWQHICNNFDLLYSTPDNIGKLRQAILQLAVQGKLVPQDENDEPASVLLEKIKFEKKQLVKEGKIKKEKPLPAIEKDDVPFELPEHWKWTRFGEIILYIESGWSPMCEKHPKEGNEWGVLKVSAVTWDNFNPSENKALPVSFEPRPEHEVKVGDFLMSRANTSQLIAKSVIVETTPERLLLSDKLLRVFFSDFTDKRFFNLYNNSPASRDYYAKKASGTSTSMRNISRDQIHNMPIPIPPLAEQKRIITKLNQLMSLCDELETKLTQSVTDSEKLIDAAVCQLLAANSNKEDSKCHLKDKLTVF
jgi:type I restriction enzyme, S subunit